MRSKAGCPDEELEDAERRRSSECWRAPPARPDGRAIERRVDPARTPRRRLSARRLSRRVRVAKTSDLSELSAGERESLDRHLNFARALRIETRVLQGSDTAETIVGFRADEWRHPDLRHAAEVERAEIMVCLGLRAAAGESCPRYASNGRRRSIEAAERRMKRPY